MVTESQTNSHFFRDSGQSKDVNAMDFSKKGLIESGFTAYELQILQNNVDSFGGTIEEVIKDLAKRFGVFIAIFIFTLLSSFSVVYLKWENVWYILSCLTSFLVVNLIVLFIQPPVIAWKSWRFIRKANN